MNDELKRCPFCGGIDIVINHDYSDGWDEIRCASCDYGTGWETKKDYAIKRWNTRPIEEQLRAELAEAQAEKYYRKVRELEIALQLNCKMEPPTTKEVKEFTHFTELYYTEMIASLQRDLAEWERQYNHRMELDKDEQIRLQSLLHSAVEQADATYLPYRKMVRDARAEVDKISQKLLETQRALHNLVEACYVADSNGELSSEIDGTLMDEAWRVLK